ncbi:MAG: hypothetical protein MHPSP_003119 [Paramarteilia canceri]
MDILLYFVRDAKSEYEEKYLNVCLSHLIDTCLSLDIMNEDRYYCNEMDKKPYLLSLDSVMKYLTLNRKLIEFH